MPTKIGRLNTPDYLNGVDMRETRKLKIQFRVSSLILFALSFIAFTGMALLIFIVKI